MSIIRQRRKNLIVSGLLGFLFGVLILTVLGYLFRQPLAELLEIAPVQTIELPETVSAMVAAKPIAKGTILEEDHVRVNMVQSENQVLAHFDDVSQLLGKKTIIDIDANMTFTSPMFVVDDLIDKDLRVYEVSFVELPYLLDIGDIVDIRIAFPTGQEYVVLSKKEVRGFERQTDRVHHGLLSLALEETEALRMSSALVDCFIADGTRVYMVKYVDPDSQQAAEVNYPVNANVMRLIKGNPNILELPSLSDTVEARTILNEALAHIIDENNQVAYKVDMATPGMALEAEADQSLTQEDQEKISKAETSVETVSEPSKKETGSDGSTSKTENTSTGIGF